MTAQSTMYWAVVIVSALLAMAWHLPLVGRLVVLGVLFVGVCALLMFWPVEEDEDA